MPSPRKSEKETSRKQLAALLGEPVFLRDEAAPKVGKSFASMKVEHHKNPPFYQKGPNRTVLYPQSWIDEFNQNGKVVKPGTTTMMFGSQPWPPAPPTSAPSAPAKPKKRINKKRRDAAIIVLDLIGETDEERRKAFIEGGSE